MRARVTRARGFAKSFLCGLFWGLSHLCEKISHVLKKSPRVFQKTPTFFQKSPTFLEIPLTFYAAIQFCHLMVLAVDRTKKLNPIWLFLWHSYHEELCKIADLRYKNTNIPLFSTIT